MGFLQEITIQFIIAFLNIFIITWPLLILLFKKFLSQAANILFSAIIRNHVDLQNWLTEAADTGTNLHTEYMNLPAD